MFELINEDGSNTKVAFCPVTTPDGVVVIPCTIIGLQLPRRISAKLRNNVTVQAALALRDARGKPLFYLMPTGDENDFILCRRTENVDLLADMLEELRVQKLAEANK